MDRATCDAPEGPRDTLYAAVARRVAGLIEAGTLRAGDRLPSLRRLSEQQDVSLSTALEAYALLQERGMIEARPQSGYYVRPRHAVPVPGPRPSSGPSAATSVDLTSVLEMLWRASADPGVVPLGAAVPGPELLPGRSLDRLVGPIMRRRRGHEAYSLPPGNEDLRREVARRALDWGGLLSPSDIVTTCGGTEALHLALMAVTKPGDTVAVESPAYFGSLLLLQGLGLKAVEVPTQPRSGLDVEALEQALRKHRPAACIASFNCHNPLGFTMSDAAKRRVVELLARHRVPLVEDDVYGDLSFAEGRPAPAKAFDREGLVLLCSSFSKFVAPGYRVGWLAAGRFQRRVVQLKYSTTLATPTLPQMAVAAFLKSGGLDRHLRAMRPACQRQVARMREAIWRFFPPGTRVTEPDGGFLLWVELPRGADTLRLFEQARQAGVSVSPGPLFSPRRRYRNCLRLNCGLAWSERVEEAVALLGRLSRG